jgi:outer membrane lipoprotein carrier protein
MNRVSTIIVVLSCSLALRGETRLDEITKRVDQHYNHMRTLTARFTESYQGAGVSRTESGTLWLKRPGKMRWQYSEPQNKLFVSDGKTAYFYVPGEQQAREAPVKKLDDLRSPLRYLLGNTKLQKEFTSLSLAPDIPAAPGDVVLRGVPKAMADRIASVLLEVTPEGEIRRIVVNEVDGSTTEFQFANQRENVPVPDEQFHFKPPPGVELVQVPEVG